MNNADATMVWNAVVALRKKDLDAVPITPYLPVPYVDSVTSATKKSYILTPMRVTVATLKCATDGEGAAAFAKYLVSGKTAEVFREFGFTMGNDIIRKEYEGGKTLPGTKPRSARAAK
jgi:ABC-type molybdate transport system substrate-binding protein